MSTAVNSGNVIVVDLTDKVSALTSISKPNHAALRSGFVGYPANPRWNTIKFRAWQTGRKWREELAQGKILVRSTDSMLIPVSTSSEQKTAEKPVGKSLNSKFLQFLTKKPTLVSLQEN